MPIRIAAALVVLGAVALAAAPAQAYELGGRRWPGRTITYYDATSYKSEVRAAVRAWNTSGVRIRFRPAPARSARVRIVHGGGRGCRGRAQLGYAGARRAPVQLGRGCAYPSLMRLVAAHELGHVLGLDHEDRFCTLMNSGNLCGQGPAFTFRCRILHRDDVLGAVRRYGGRVRPVRKDLFCPSFAPPRAPAGFAVALDGRIVRASATILEPRRLVGDPGPVVFAKLVAYRYPGACPAAPGDGPPLKEGGVEYGAWTGDVELVPPPGTWCYAFAVEDATGRRSPFSTAQLVVAPPPPTPTPSAAAAPR